MPAGSNPVVHLRKGKYNVSSTINVPANIQLTIVGDGASESGSLIMWKRGPSTGPVVWLKGPSRATLSDLVVHGLNTDGVRGMVIDNANQTGGRIYGYEVSSNGNNITNNQYVDPAFDISGINQTHIDLHAVGLTNYMTGIRVTGGPGHVQFLTGATAIGNRILDVRNRAALLATAMWYEGQWAFQDSLVHLSTNGNLAFSSMHWAADSTYPMLRTDNFSGSMTAIANGLYEVGSTLPYASFTGDGSQTNVFLASNTPTPVATAADATTADQTSPSGQIAQITNVAGSTVLPWVTNKAVNTQPTQQFVENMLALHRTMEPLNRMPFPQVSPT